MFCKLVVCMVLLSLTVVAYRRGGFPYSGYKYLSTSTGIQSNHHQIFGSKTELVSIPSGKTNVNDLDTNFEKLSVAQIANILHEATKIVKQNTKFSMAPYIAKLARRLKYLEHEDWEISQIAWCLHSLHYLDMNCEGVQIFVSTLSRILLRKLEIMDAKSRRQIKSKYITMMLFGIRGLDPSYVEVRNLVQAIKNLFQLCNDPIDARYIGNLLYGFANMDTNYKEIRNILEEIPFHLHNIQGFVTGHSICYGIYGLQSMDSSTNEIKILLKSCSNLIRSIRTPLSFDMKGLGNALYGLQKMDPREPEVAEILSLLVERTYNLFPALSDFIRQGSMQNSVHRLYQEGLITSYFSNYSTADLISICEPIAVIYEDLHPDLRTDTIKDLLQLQNYIRYELIYRHENVYHINHNHYNYKYIKNNQLKSVSSINLIQKIIKEKLQNNNICVVFNNLLFGAVPSDVLFSIPGNLITDGTITSLVNIEVEDYLPYGCHKVSQQRFHAVRDEYLNRRGIHVQRLQIPDEYYDNEEYIATAIQNIIQKFIKPSVLDQTETPLRTSLTSQFSFNQTYLYA